MNEYQRAWRKKNRERVNAYNRKWLAKNPRKRREYRARWLGKPGNREKLRGWNRAKDKRWRKANPEKNLAILKRATAKSRDKLTDRYVRYLVCKMFGVKAAQVPPAAVELKRAQMKRFRRTGKVRKTDRAELLPLLETGAPIVTDGAARNG